MSVLEELRRPLPKADLAAYARHRLVEALVEAVLALDFLKDGLERNAAGKAFQAWKALLAAYAALERERLRQLAARPSDLELLEDKAILIMPTGGMTRVAQLLEKAGHRGMSFATERALGLHRYQYNGPDPGGELSPYRDPETAATAVVELAAALRDYAARLRESAWSDAAERALGELDGRLGRAPHHPDELPPL